MYFKMHVHESHVFLVSQDICIVGIFSELRLEYKNALGINIISLTL